MTRLYNICGLPVECDFRYPTMTARAEKYLTDHTSPPEISVSCSAKYVELLQKNNPALSEDECEIIATAESFYRQLLRHNGFITYFHHGLLGSYIYLFEDSFIMTTLLCPAGIHSSLLRKT